MEAVAAARRELPPGGPVPEDYVFEAAGAVLSPIGSRSLPAVIARERTSSSVTTPGFRPERQPAGSVRDARSQSDSGRGLS
jgi:hypothetical protein